MDGFDLYQAIGGTVTCSRLSAAFYARVARDPVLRPLFPGKSLRCAIEAFSAFLAQLLGGVHSGAAERAIALAEASTLQTYFAGNRSSRRC